MLMLLLLSIPALSTVILVIVFFGSAIITVASAYQIVECVCERGSNNTQNWGVVCVYLCECFGETCGQIFPPFFFFFFLFSPLYYVHTYNVILSVLLCVYTAQHSTQRIRSTKGRQRKNMQKWLRHYIFSFFCTPAYLLIGGGGGCNESSPFGVSLNARINIYVVFVLLSHTHTTNTGTHTVAVWRCAINKFCK